jgi:hypothetical protein
MGQDAEGTYKTYIGAGALPPDGFTNPADPRVQEELTDPSGHRWTRMTFPPVEPTLIISMIWVCPKIGYPATLNELQFQWVESSFSHFSL